MRTRTMWYTVCAIALAAVAPSTATNGAEPVARAYDKLPSPYETITGNIGVLERDGLFTITGAKFDTVGYLHEDAVVWTLQANRPVTYRNIEIVLRPIRDVRFYRRPKPSSPADSGRADKDKRTRSPAEVHSTILFYSDTITTGAANGDSLARGQSIDVWIYIGPSDVTRINTERANRLVLREYYR